MQIDPRAQNGLPPTRAGVRSADVSSRLNTQGNNNSLQIANNHKHIQVVGTPSPYYASPARVSSADGKHGTNIGRSVVLANGNEHDQNGVAGHTSLPITPTSKDRMDNIKAIQMIYQQHALKQSDRSRNQNQTARSFSQQNAQLKHDVGVQDGNNQYNSSQTVSPRPQQQSPYSKTSKKLEGQEMKTKQYKQTKSSPYYSKPVSSKRLSQKPSHSNQFKFQKQRQHQHQQLQLFQKSSEPVCHQSGQGVSSHNDKGYSRPTSVQKPQTTGTIQKNFSKNGKFSTFQARHHGISRGSMQTPNTIKYKNLKNQESDDYIIEVPYQSYRDQPKQSNESIVDTQSQQVQTMQATPNGRINSKRQASRAKNQGISQHSANIQPRQQDCSQQSEYQSLARAQQIDVKDDQEFTQSTSTTIVNGWMAPDCDKQKSQNQSGQILSNHQDVNSKNRSKVINGHFINNTLLFRQQSYADVQLPNRPHTCNNLDKSNKEYSKHFTHKNFVSHQSDANDTWTSFVIDNEEFKELLQGDERCRGDEDGIVQHDYGMTLDQYIQSMCTTPANDNSTTGLGIEQWYDAAKTPYSESPEPELTPDERSTSPITTISKSKNSDSLVSQNASRSETNKILDLMNDIIPADGEECARYESKQDLFILQCVNDMYKHNNMEKSVIEQQQPQLTSQKMLTMANANERDLRPGTAFDIFSTEQVSDHSQPQSINEVKEVDLASLSSTIFQPRTDSLQSYNERKKYQDYIADDDVGHQQSHRQSDQSSRNVSGQLPVRQIQSARAGHVADKEVDPSVWQTRSIPRPPSRQKPPPEALHLFSPEHTCGIIRQDTCRPATAIGMMRRQKQSLSIGSKAGFSSSYERPPSRQRPPPESLNLGFDSLPNSSRRENLRRKYSAQSSLLKVVEETVEV